MEMVLVAKEEKREEDGTEAAGGGAAARAPRRLGSSTRLPLQDNHRFPHRSTSDHFSSSLPALHPRIEQEDQEGHSSHLILGQLHHICEV